MLDWIDHRDPSCLNVSQNFVVVNFHNFYQFGKPQIPFGAMIEITIQTLQQIFNARNQR
jgi:hypothetical protein